MQSTRSTGRHEIDAMAAKVLANLIVMGSGILARAVVQAYRQALANASKSGVAQETIQNVTRRASKVMTEQEARQILGVTEKSTWEEIVQASVSYRDFGFALLFDWCEQWSGSHLKCSPTDLTYQRNMITYSKGMLRMGAFTSNRKFTGLRNVWNRCISPKIRELLLECLYS